MPCYPPRTPAHPTASGERSDPYWLILVSHGNARLTVHGRKLIVARHQAGWRQAHIAAAMGISRQCVRTWITRYDAEGEAGLEDLPRPGKPSSLPESLRDRVLELTLTEPPTALGATHWSSRLLASALAGEGTSISHVTIARIWHRFGVQPWRAQTFK